MSHEFIVKKNGIIEIYTQYEDIPLDFDHIIKFKVEIPDEPHSEVEHEEIEKWNDRLQTLIKIEKENASRNKTR